jgi:hypothetical protein
MPPIDRSIEPVEALADAFDDGHAAYQHWRDGVQATGRGI